MAKKQTKPRKKKTDSEELYSYLVKKGKQFSKELMQNATPYEKTLYRHLKDLHYKFQFQIPIICNKKHLYIADFIIEDKLVIEVDGKFHNTPDNKKKDNLRTKRLLKEGFLTIRFANSQIATLTKEEIHKIIQAKLTSINLDNSK